MLGRNVPHRPRPLSDFANSYVLGRPKLFWILIVVVLGCEGLLRATTFGRYVYAIGSNREAARLTGVNTRLVTYGVYGLGALRMTTINNGAVVLGIDPNYMKVLVGGILIATVAVDQIRKRRFGD